MFNYSVVMHTVLVSMVINLSLWRSLLLKISQGIIFSMQFYKI